MNTPVDKTFTFNPAILLAATPCIAAAAAIQTLNKRTFSILALCRHF